MNRYLAVSAILLLCFVIIAFLVSPNFGNASISTKDTDMFVKVNHSHSLSLNKLMMFLADYGREAVWSVTMILLFIFGGMSGRKTAIMMFLIMIVLVPSVLAAKEIVERPRPTVSNVEYLIKPESEYSYPSGHATIVSAGAATMLVFFRESFRKLAITIGLTVEAALVCISVVYVGVHYPLDVIGGILFGTGVSFIFIGFVKYFENIISLVSRSLRKTPR